MVGIIPLVNSVAVCFTPAKYYYYLAHVAGGKNCMKLGALISDMATATSPAHQHNGVVQRCAKWILCGSCTPQIGFEFSTWVPPKATAHHHSDGGGSSFFLCIKFESQKNSYRCNVDWQWLPPPIALLAVDLNSSSGGEPKHYLGWKRNTMMCKMQRALQKWVHPLRKSGLTRAFITCANQMRQEQNQAVVLGYLWIIIIGGFEVR